MHFAGHRIPELAARELLGETLDRGTWTGRGLVLRRLRLRAVGDDDLPSRATVVYPAERIDDLAQRKAAIDERLDLALRHEACDGRHVFRLERLPPQHQPRPAVAGERDERAD